MTIEASVFGLWIWHCIAVALLSAFFGLETSIISVAAFWSIAMMTAGIAEVIRSMNEFSSNPKRFLKEALLGSGALVLVVFGLLAFPAAYITIKFARRLRQELSRRSLAV